MTFKYKNRGDQQRDKCIAHDQKLQSETNNGSSYFQGIMKYACTISPDEDFQ
jgi:hypothetical protein